MFCFVSLVGPSVSVCVLFVFQTYLVFQLRCFCFICFNTSVLIARLCARLTLEYYCIACFIMSLLGKCVLVSGLTEIVTRDDLSGGFAAFGTVRQVVWKLDQHGELTGKAVVLFEDLNHAKLALDTKKKGTWTISAVDFGEDELKDLIKDQELEDAVFKSLKESSTGGKERLKRQLREAGVVLPVTLKEEQFSQALPHSSTPKKFDSSQDFKQDVGARPKVPKLPTFSGDRRTKDASFARWQYHVKVLQHGPYENYIILNAVNQSLRTPAADLVVNMGADVTVTDILRKFKSRYGSVLSVEALTEKLYALKQEKEDLSAWAFRIEEVVYEIEEKDGIQHSDVPAKVRGRFWYGLQDSKIKEATRASWATMPFDDLLEQCRALEEEYSASAASAKVQQQTNFSLEGKIDKLIGMFEDVDTRLKKVEACVMYREDVKPQEPQKPKEKKPAYCTKCKKEGHLYFGCKKGTDTKCLRCDQVGHLRNCCRVRLNRQ